MTDDLRSAILARCAELRNLAEAAQAAPGGHWFVAAWSRADAALNAQFDPAAVMELVAGAEEMCEVHKPGDGWVDVDVIGPGDPCEGCGYSANGDFAMNTVAGCPSLRLTVRMIGARIS